MFRLPVPSVRRTREHNDCNLPAGEDGGRFGANDDPRCGSEGAKGLRDRVSKIDPAKKVDYALNRVDKVAGYFKNDPDVQQRAKARREHSDDLSRRGMRIGYDDLQTPVKTTGRPSDYTPPKPPDYGAFEARAIENLNKTSRTAGGVSDTSSSADKPKLNTEGDALAAKTAENFKSALGEVWTAKDHPFDTPEQVLSFAEHIASTVSDGLLAEGQGLYRSWETKNAQEKPENIKQGMHNFAADFHKRMSSGEDPITTAAWVEKEMSFLHPWADGVGRTTKILSALPLLRAGMQVPSYPDKKTYYKEVVKSPAEWESYYRGLFGKTKESRWRVRESRRMVADSSPLREFNNCHNPAGGPGGGQFCSGGGKNGGSEKWDWGRKQPSERNDGGFSTMGRGRFSKDQYADAAQLARTQANKSGTDYAIRKMRNGVNGKDEFVVSRASKNDSDYARYEIVKPDAMRPLVKDTEDNDYDTRPAGVGRRSMFHTPAQAQSAQKMRAEHKDVEQAAARKEARKKAERMGVLFRDEASVKQDVAWNWGQKGERSGVFKPNPRLATLRKEAGGDLKAYRDHLEEFLDESTDLTMADLPIIDAEIAAINKVLRKRKK